MQIYFISHLLFSKRKARLYYLTTFDNSVLFLVQDATVDSALFFCLCFLFFFFIHRHCHNWLIAKVVITVKKWEKAI